MSHFWFIATIQDHKKDHCLYWEDDSGLCTSEDGLPPGSDPDWCSTESRCWYKCSHRAGNHTADTTTLWDANHHPETGTTQSTSHTWDVLTTKKVPKSPLRSYPFVTWKMYCSQSGKDAWYKRSDTVRFIRYTPSSFFCFSCRAAWYSEYRLEGTPTFHQRGAF